MVKNIILTVLLFTSFSVIGSENTSLGNWIITKEENKLIIGYKPYSRTQTVSEFKIDHIDEVSKSVSKYCGWKL